MLDGNAPEVTQTKRKGLRFGRRRIMEIITIFFEVFSKIFVIFSAESLQAGCARRRKIYPPQRLIIP